MGTTILGRKNDYADPSIIEAGELNGVANDLEWIAAGYLALDVSGNTDVELSEAQYETSLIELTGTLTGDIALILPAHAGRRWKLYNATSGGYHITAKVSGGTGVGLRQGCRTEVGSDGTDIRRLAGELSGTTDNRAYVGSLVVNGGTPLTGLLSASTTWDPANMADGAVVATTVAVAGAAVGDPAYASLSTLGSNNVLISAHVQAADTVRVVVENKSGGALDLASGTLRVGVLKF